MLVNGFLFTSSSGTASYCLTTVWKSKVSNEVFAKSLHKVYPPSPSRELSTWASAQ